MIEYFIWYIIIGLIWAAFLEYYTTKNLPEPYNRSWTMPERMMHLFFWPVSFGKFVIEFCKGLFGYYDDEE